MQARLDKLKAEAKARIKQVSSKMTEVQDQFRTALQLGGDGNTPPLLPDCSNPKPLGEDWTITVSNITEVPTGEDCLLKGCAPDGKLCVLGNSIYFCNFENWRTLGTGPTVEEQSTMEPKTPIFGGRQKDDLTLWDSGGKWFIGIHPPYPGFNSCTIGFFHAESHWAPPLQEDPWGTAWKSMGVALSHDRGNTWTAGEQILTGHKPKPEKPEWGGQGDGTVIFDPPNKRWVAFFPDEGITAAVSYDPLGRPGTWKKYFEGDFTEPGLGGKCTTLVKESYGGNPTVVWNTHLRNWVMMWHSWNGPIFASVSPDLLTWAKPRLMQNPSKEGRSAWYPNLIGWDDKVCGRTAKLYWSDIDWVEGCCRKFMSADVCFEEGRAAE